MNISANKMVSVIYDLTVGEGDQVELMERATPEVPLTFIFGIGQMLEDFEKNLVGLKLGEKFDFTISPEKGYGEYDEEHVVELPKDMFIVDGKFDDEVIKPGNVVPMMDNAGNRLNGSVVSVDDSKVVMDFNHPLAGETLHFKGEVIDVHEPTAEELAAMMPQMTGGCGSCGCGDNEGDCSDSGCGSGCGCH
ncbi:MAG: FKBP-type peptidyl-prolyl cis-trans isomerase [Tannerellaceae bacterium]